jgi:hypothetical protein
VVLLQEVEVTFKRKLPAFFDIDSLSLRMQHELHFPVSIVKEQDLDDAQVARFTLPATQVSRAISILNRLLDELRIIPTTTRAFLPRASLFIFEGASSEKSVVQFQSYPAAPYPVPRQHEVMTRRIARVPNLRSPADPMYAAWMQFMCRGSEQLHYLRATYMDEFGKIKASIRFGLPYFTNGMNDANMTIENLEETVTKQSWSPTMSVSEQAILQELATALAKQRGVQRSKNKKKRRKNGKKVDETPPLRSAFLCHVPNGDTKLPNLVRGWRMVEVTKESGVIVKDFDVSGIGQVTVTYPNDDTSQDGKAGLLKCRKKMWLCADMSPQAGSLGFRISVQTQKRIQLNNVHVSRLIDQGIDEYNIRKQNRQRYKYDGGKKTLKFARTSHSGPNDDNASFRWEAFVKIKLTKEDSIPEWLQSTWDEAIRIWRQLK